MADGILTPAVSVTSAAAGIAVSKPSLGTPSDIVGLSLVCISPSLLQLLLPIIEHSSQAFLIPLFLVQPFGAGRLGFTFAPSE